MTAGLELGAASTAVVWRAPGLHQALAVAGDDVWFWTFGSPERRWADLAGTFRVTATPAEQSALAALAADGDEPADGLALLLTAAGRTARVGAGSALAGRIGDVVGPLLDRLRAAPLSVVALAGGVVRPPGAPAAVLGLTVSGVGVEPTRIGLDADGIRLGGPDGSWRDVPAPRMGLVDADGDLLDGLYAPATVPPGGRGGWIQPGVTGGDADRVQVRGTVQVVGPVPPAMIAFTMTADLTPAG